MSEFEALFKSYEATAYFKWMHDEGIPVLKGYGVEDVRKLELSPWKRTGGKGTFVSLYGMEGTTGMYVAEIPPGGALEPEKHMYEEVICILDGNGATEIWQDGGKKHTFEWGKWSLFAPPLNTWHRLINGSREPVRFYAMTTAPLVIDLYRDLDFIFNCPFKFTRRFAEEKGYFNESSKRYTKGLDPLWETNFISDVLRADIDSKEIKGPGWRTTQYELAGNALIGHLAEWPPAMYNKAHYHGPGAVLLMLQSQGYSLIWPKDVGPRPYESGKGEEVMRIPWRESSLVAPPGGWFHQHFNTGTEAGRQLAVRYGSRLYPLAWKLASQKTERGIFVSIKKGGTLIDYEDEDPAIREQFEAELGKTGAHCQMPPIAKSA
jgi:mannose-6-phosphate isomerase-like protein (cupin superfamily)